MTDYTLEQIEVAVETIRHVGNTADVYFATELLCNALPQLLKRVRELEAHYEHGKGLARQASAKLLEQAAEIEMLTAESGVADGREAELCKIIDEHEAEIERLKGRNMELLKGNARLNANIQSVLRQQASEREE